MARRLAAERKANCTKYMLLGTCDYGKKCSFRHDFKARRTYTEYVPFPEKIPISVAVGRHARNLRSALPKGLQCIVVPTDGRPDKREVKVVAIDQQSLDTAVKNLQVIFSQLFPIGPSWCYFHTEGLGLTENALLEFQVYKGRLPSQHYQMHEEMYAVCCRHQASQASASADTSLEDLKKLNPKQSPLDSWDQLHSALDGVMEGRLPADETAKILHPKSYPRARIMLEYRDNIKTNLQGALEWMRKPENQQPGTTAKLEGRFGKMLWFNLPEDVLASDEPLNVKTFAEFVFDTNHSQIFDTDVKSENASSLHTTLQDIAESKAVLETFDIKFTSRKVKVDLRLKNNSGRPEIVVVKKNEQKVVVCDILCLHRQHDLRLSLNRYETVPKGDETVQKLLSTVKMCDPETLQLVPCADDWVVNFIRHKKRETFFIEGKYMVTVTTVKEHDVNWKEMRPGDSINVKPEDYNEPHMEVEFHNILWECMFGKAIGLSPEQSLALFTETPVISPEVVSLIPPDSWDVETILKDIDEVFENLDSINESLGTISEQ